MKMNLIRRGWRCSFEPRETRRLKEKEVCCKDKKEEEEEEEEEDRNENECGNTMNQESMCVEMFI